MNGSVVTPVPIEQRDLTEYEARELTASVSGTLVDIATLPGRILKLHEGRAWVAMKYRSWGDYLHGEFEGALSGLDRDTKRGVHNLLRELGTSTRDIAAVTGMNDKTVRNDTPTAEISAVESRDGKTRPAHASASTAANAAPVIEDAEILEDEDEEPTHVPDSDRVVNVNLGGLPCMQPLPEEPSPKIIGHIRRAEETLAKAIATNLHEEELADLDRAIKNINDRYAHKLAMIEHTRKLIANNQDD